MSKNTNYLVVLNETKDSKDGILNLCYPWVFTHGCWTPRSPRNTRNLAEMEKILVLCNMYGSIEYQIFPAIIPSYLAQSKLNKHAFLHSFLLNTGIKDKES